MSHHYKPLTISTKHKKLQFINGIVHLHDLTCQCDEPLQHTIGAIFEQEPNLPLNEKDKQLIKKCLTSGDHTEEDGDVLGDVDLEKFFAEDTFGEDDKTG